MYEYSTHDALEEAEKGNIKLGGCEVFQDGTVKYFLIIEQAGEFVIKSSSY